MRQAFVVSPIAGAERLADRVGSGLRHISPQSSGAAGSGTRAHLKRQSTRVPTICRRGAGACQRVKLLVTGFTGRAHTSIGGVRHFLLPRRLPLLRHGKNHRRSDGPPGFDRCAAQPVSGAGTALDFKTGPIFCAPFHCLTLHFAALPFHPSVPQDPASATQPRTSDSARGDQSAAASDSSTAHWAPAIIAACC